MGKNKKAEKKYREQAIKIVENMIKCEKSELSTKFKKAFDKVSVKLKKHIVEIIGADNTIKYGNKSIKLKKKEYKQLMKLFLEEKFKRDGSDKDFPDIEEVINQLK